MLNYPKKLRDKHDTVMKHISEICGAFKHKTISHQFFLSTDDPV